MLATSYPLLDVFLSILWFALFFVWVYTLIAIFTDVVRSRDLTGGGKAAWFLFVLCLPFLGAFVYLIARGGSMHERAVRAVEDHEEAFRRYVERTARGGDSTADQLHKLDDLRSRGILTDAEFESEKAKLLS